MPWFLLWLACTAVCYGLCELTAERRERREAEWMQGDEGEGE